MIDNPTTENEVAALVPPQREHRAWGTTLRLVKRFLPFAKPYRSAIAGASVLIVVRVLTDLVQPWPLKVVIDNVLHQRALRIPYLPDLSLWLSQLDRWDLLLFCALFMVMRTLLDGLFTYLSSVRMTAIGQQIIFDIRCALFDHVQRLSLPFFDRQRTGDLVTRFTSDSSNIEDMLVSVVSVSLVNGLTIMATAVVMLRLDWHLTLVAFIVLPFMFLTNRYFTKRIREAARERRRKEGEIASLVQEDLSLIRTVQTFVRESHEAAKFNLLASAARAAGLRSNALQSQFLPLNTFVTGMGTTIIICLGARSVLSGNLSLGTLIVLLTYLRSLYSPVKQLSRLVAVVTKAAVSAERVAEILDTPPHITDAPDAIDAPPLTGQISFEKVSFAYKDREGSEQEHSVLHNICLEIPAGMTVALVGKTGAGKTTLSSLLSRFYDPISGIIRIDGHDLRTLKHQSLRRQISIVPQDAVLFRASIWENIAYGCDLFAPGYGIPTTLSTTAVPPTEELMKRVYAAAQAANAHEFVKRLPQGYFTIVGERGNTLSGGQRQRIAIARAIVRDAPILILDEPTTGLDTASEDLVLEALDRLKKGRTTLIIAHRLTTIRSAGLIVVLEGGRIIECGKHSDLFERRGRYRDLYERQFQSEMAEIRA